MIAFLILSVCLTGHPANKQNCRDITRLDNKNPEIQFVFDNETQCYSSAMISAAQWIGDNPDWTLHEMRCEVQKPK